LVAGSTGGLRAISVATWLVAAIAAGSLGWADVTLPVASIATRTPIMCSCGAGAGLAATAVPAAMANATANR